ncbi:MAG: hypothetical protein ACYDGR_15985 [Candidatus Dormibacteria bacterium]
MRRVLLFAGSGCGGLLTLLGLLTLIGAVASASSATKVSGVIGGFVITGLGAAILGPCIYLLRALAHSIPIPRWKPEQTTIGTDGLPRDSAGDVVLAPDAALIRRYDTLGWIFVGFFALPGLGLAIGGWTRIANSKRRLSSLMRHLVL